MNDVPLEFLSMLRHAGLLDDGETPDFEELTGSNNLERYGDDVETLREIITVKELDPQVRTDWAVSLADWPKEMVAELEAKGLPATLVLETVLESAERHGYTWPVRYELE